MKKRAEKFNSEKALKLVWW